VHNNEKSVVAVRGPVNCEPLVANVPLQPPEETHVWAPVEFQDSVVCAPLAIVVDAAVSVTVGAFWTTTTCVWAVVVPFGP
jgi:hypothetical protein